MYPSWVQGPKQGGAVKLSVSRDGVHVDDILLNRAATTFGRNSASCDVALDHASLSRKHALIGYNGSGIACLLDLGSTHGTFLNGERLPADQPLTLEVGDVITFGASTRKYEIAAAGAEPAGQISRGVSGVVFIDDGAMGSMPPPPPVAHKLSSQTHAGHTHVGSTYQVEARPTTDEDKARERAELQAAIASMNRPVVYVPRPEPEGQSGGREVDVEYADLPLAFGSRRDRPVKRARTERVDAHNKEEEDNEDEEDDEDFGPRPTGGGEAVGDEEQGDDFGPAPPSSLAAAAAGVRTPAALAEHMGLPISHEAVLGGHAKTVNCAGFDAGGGRLATGSADNSFRLFDFGGMDRSHRSFRDGIPHDGQPVRCICWTPTGDRFAVATGSAQLKAFDREGRSLMTTIKGDMYLSDAVNTKGHQGPATWVGWHTAAGRKDTLLSASADGTIRLWDVANGKRVFEELVCSDVIKFRNARGQKAGVTTAAIDPAGKFVLAGLEDGSIHMVVLKGPGFRYTRSDATLRDAHAAGGISSLVFSPDASLFASRGSDDVVRVWGATAITDHSKALVTISGVHGVADSANVAWSPDGKLLVAGTAVATGKVAVAEEGSTSVAQGRLIFFDIAALRGQGGDASAPTTVSIPAEKAAAFSVALGPRTSAIHISWQPRINQIAVTCSDGATRLLYSPSLSTKGALLSSARATKPRDAASDYFSASVGTIYLPNALPMFREDAGPLAGGKRRRPEDSVRSEILPGGGSASGPAKPVDMAAPTPGVVPEYISHAKRTFTEYFMQHAVTDVGAGGERNLRSEDPQAVLTAYATRAPSGTIGAMFTKAYAGTQPKVMLAEKTLEEERDEADRAKAKRERAMSGR